MKLGIGGKSKLYKANKLNNLQVEVGLKKSLKHFRKEVIKHVRE